MVVLRLGARRIVEQDEGLIAEVARAKRIISLALSRVLHQVKEWANVDYLVLAISYQVSLVIRANAYLLLRQIIQSLLKDIYVYLVFLIDPSLDK